MTPDVSSVSTVCWIVGAAYHGNEDQTPRFLEQGLWEIDNPSEKESALVRSFKAGDRIAIKATYTRKNQAGLPFDNHGQFVSVMAIKAVGRVLENPLDGERVRVTWSPAGPVREWYLNTYQRTIWRVTPGDWMADELIGFVFDGRPQDLDRFRNAPFWRGRFGTPEAGRARFAWTPFYEAMADRLAEFRHDRGPLVAGIKAIAARVEGLGHLGSDQFPDGSQGFLNDICPFTTLGLFNRNVTVPNRRAIAGELAALLGVELPVPTSFEGIPVLNNQKSWFFPFEKDRPANQIDQLWDFFNLGLVYAGSDRKEDHAGFEAGFDQAMALNGVGWNLTSALYWMRPWCFATLDANSRTYLKKKLQIDIGRNGPKGRCDAKDYLAVMENLETNFQLDSYPDHGFPELSLHAYQYTPPTPETEPEPDPEDGDTTPALPGGGGASPAATKEVPIIPYSIDQILQEGCFLEQDELETLLKRLDEKKNLILQGPPGTGKSWLAKRLGFALMGQVDESRVRAVQFHPNLSYEDFVRGLRPAGDGRLAVQDGVFLEAVQAAVGNPAEKYVVVIEEINRGNPAQIFGELLTLLEAGKRSPDFALELCYPDPKGGRRPVHIPENLYIIGTMNIADRSLALVDLALRRRFAFADLEPRLGQRWLDWVVQELKLEAALAQDIAQRMGVLNRRISEDARLGADFRVGHSYVTPTKALEPGDTRDWFRRVVDSELRPLLREYWYEAPEEARKAGDLLLEGW